MRLLLTFLALALSLGAFADEKKMAVITSDVDTDVYDFYLITNDDNQVDSVRYVMKSKTGQINEDHTYPAEVVMQDGIVLVERNGYEAVRLKVPQDFSLDNGGTIILDYLYSGVTNVRRIHNLKLQKKDGNFALTDTKDQVINKMFVYGNWNRILGLIGVREITTSYGFIAD